MSWSWDQTKPAAWSLLYGQHLIGAGNKWAKGYSTDGNELIDEPADIIRRETEGCDCPRQR